jgi:hypothetical protein
MRRPNPSTPGSKFTVRGQAYVQTGAFFHTMRTGYEVRVLELATTCPECAEPFDATASLRQIRTRQLVRRCPACRKVHTGPVPIVTPAARKAVKKKTPGRKARKASRRPAAACESAPSDRITLLEVRPVSLQPGETPATALYRSVLGMTDEPAAEAEQHQRLRDALSDLD